MKIQWSRKKSKVETVEEFTYLGNRVSAGGGCEAHVTDTTRCDRLRECNKLLYGRRFPPKVKGAVHKCNTRPAILYVSETWCLKERLKFYE